jgi:hypothetical protein
MKRRAAFAAGAAVVLLVGWGSDPQVRLDDLESRVGDLEKRLRDANDRIDALEFALGRHRRLDH